ncbi:glycosyltransferase [Thermoactinospora rubra]|uniref:glycosyltransferase n=1 Tax=Thermoactinospora rubra TaxID=1088767 RepID=UPI001F0AD3A9|nr:glycosyltransferase [Thermoactinospora rubra]
MTAPVGFVRTPEKGMAALRWTPGGWRVDGRAPDPAELRALRGLEVEWPAEPAPLAEVLSLAAAGVPLTAETAPAWVPADLAALLTDRSWLACEPDGTLRCVADLRREEHSVRLRRLAAPPTGRPRVSVVMATVRPHLVASALAQMARQRHVEVEAVVALHGVTLDSRAAPLPVTWVEAPAELPFGEVLNLAAERAAGDYVTKWDDDDWYGPEHLADLIRAMRATGADIVGTTAEFFYLERLDTTIRRVRFASGASYPSEVWADHVAGGTILLARDRLRELGGFPALPRAVDRHFLQAASEAGARIYRTHGLGYVLRRAAAEEHTWRLPLAHFLRVQANQWHGFRPSRLLEHAEPDRSPNRPPDRVRANDYRTLRPPRGDWTPTLRVSVVIPAYGAQDKLDLVLAALSRQTYPASLTEVIVVDNGSEPPLRVPPWVRLVRCPAPGRANARNAGLAAATGDVIHWLDSDVVLTPGAVEAHMRWHHAAPYLSVTGTIRFTSAPVPAELPEDLEAAFEPAEPHGWIVDLLDRTDGLTGRTERPFSIHVGGATSVNAALLRAAGPMDEELILGQDTEMGYRLAQAGAVFVPEPSARAYHLGSTMRMRDKAPIDRVSHAFVADRIPTYRWLRSHPARQWKVPYVTAVVRAGGYEETRATVDALLAGTVPDVSVVLAGPWESLARERRAPLRDPGLDLVLLRGHYAHEGRVRLAATEEADPAVPYVLRVPAGWIPGEDTLARLLDLARGQELGMVAVLLEESPVVAARLERTAAFARAALLARPGEALEDVVDDVFGVCWVEGQEYGWAREAAPPTGRRSAYRARVQAEAEAARLAAEVERLRGQVARWREEAAQWRRKSVDLRREVGALRRELGALRRPSWRGVAASVKQMIRRGVHG